MFCVIKKQIEARMRIAGRRVERRSQIYVAIGTMTKISVFILRTLRNH
jgi:hypothetical protein